MRTLSVTIQSLNRTHRTIFPINMRTTFRFFRRYLKETAIKKGIYLRKFNPRDFFSLIKFHASNKLPIWRDEHSANIFVKCLEFYGILRYEVENQPINLKTFLKKFLRKSRFSYWSDIEVPVADIILEALEDCPILSPLERAYAGLYDE